MRIAQIKFDLLAVATQLGTQGPRQIAVQQATMEGVGIDALSSQVNFDMPIDEIALPLELSASCQRHHQTVKGQPLAQPVELGV